MEQKTYELVARTRENRVEMARSIVYEQARVFVNELDMQLRDWETRPDEVEKLLECSDIYERCGDFMLQCGYMAEAVREYCEAADICFLASEKLWVRTEEGWGLCRRLRRRFVEMQERCFEVVEQAPQLGRIMRSRRLDGDYRSIAAARHERCRRG